MMHALAPPQTDTCMSFHRVQRKLGSQAQLRQYGFSTAWDIEDLVQLGQKVRVRTPNTLRQF